MSRVPVTEAEKQTPYYKYFTRELIQPPQEKLDLLENNPLTPETALRAPDLNKLFDPGYLPGEFGFTRFKDGTMTIANLTPMPGVTVEMFDWWFAWHGLEPMRYKIWDPEDHYHCLTRNPEIAKNTSLSMKERYWNTTHDVVEDMGTGKSKLAISFRNPAEIGFDPEKLKTFDGTIVCAAGEQLPVIMCHFVRPVNGGIELRTRFWVGYRIRNGRPTKVSFPPMRLFPAKIVRALLSHNVKEFNLLADVLPKLYEEFRDNF